MIAKRSLEKARQLRVEEEERCAAKIFLYGLSEKLGADISLSDTETDDSGAIRLIIDLNGYLRDEAKAKGLTAEKEEDFMETVVSAGKAIKDTVDSVNGFFRSKGGSLITMEFPDYDYVFSDAKTFFGKSGDNGDDGYAFVLIRDKDSSQGGNNEQGKQI